MGSSSKGRQAELGVGRGATARQAGALGSDGPGLGPLAGCPELITVLELGPHLHNGHNDNYSWVSAGGLVKHL